MFRLPTHDDARANARGILTLVPGALTPRLAAGSAEESRRMNPDVTAFFDEATYTVSYVVADPDKRQGRDHRSVLGYDSKSGWTNTEKADEIIAFVQTRIYESSGYWKPTFTPTT